MPILLQFKHQPDRQGTVRHTDALSLLQELPSDQVGAVITDPPFFCSTAGPWSVSADIDAMSEFYGPIAEQCARVLRPGGATVVMGGADLVSAWEFAAHRAGLLWRAELTVLWNTGLPRIANFGSLTTAVRWHMKPGARSTFNSVGTIFYSNVIVCSKVPQQDRHHPAQKPVELTNFLVSLLSNEGDLVVDPFCGSGSTLVSAAMCDRCYIGSDIDLQQCLIASARPQRLELEAANLRPLCLWTNGQTESIES